MSAQLEPLGTLPRRRQLLVCRASGQTLQWDVPSLATSLAEGACNALVEKATADWETLYCEYRDSGGAEMKFEDEK